VCYVTCCLIFRNSKRYNLLMIVASGRCCFFSFLLHPDIISFNQSKSNRLVKAYYRRIKENYSCGGAVRPVGCTVVHPVLIKLSCILFSLDLACYPWGKTGIQKPSRRSTCQPDTPYKQVSWIPCSNWLGKAHIHP
jgi:hypothetical protein